MDCKFIALMILQTERWFILQEVNPLRTRIQGFKLNFLIDHIVEHIIEAGNLFKVGSPKVASDPKILSTWYIKTKMMLYMTSTSDQVAGLEHLPIEL